MGFRPTERTDGRLNPWLPGSLAILLALGCSGGGKDDKPKPKPRAATPAGSPPGPQDRPPKPGTPAPEGFWSGTVTLNGRTFKAHALVLGAASGGEARIILEDKLDTLLVMNLPRDPASVAAGAGNGAVLDGNRDRALGILGQGRMLTTVEENGAPAEVGRILSCTLDPIASSDAFGGTFLVQGKEHGQFAFQRSRKIIYDRPITLESLVGFYRGRDPKTHQPDGPWVEVHADGRLTLSQPDGSAEFAGRLTIPDPARSAFRVTLDHFGGQAIPRPYEGTGCVGDPGKPTQRLLLVLDDGTRRMVRPFFPTAKSL